MATFPVDAWCDKSSWIIFTAGLARYLWGIVLLPACPMRKGKGRGDSFIETEVEIKNEWEIKKEKKGSQSQARPESSASLANWSAEQLQCWSDRCPCPAHGGSLGMGLHAGWRAGEDKRFLSLSSSTCSVVRMPCLQQPPVVWYALVPKF